MNQFQKQLRDEAAENFVNQQQEKSNYVVGMPVSPLFYEGLQQGFEKGHDFAFERAKVLEEALETIIAQNADMSDGDIRDSWHQQARAALAEWRGTDDQD